MKKKYLEPDVEVLKFQAEDIIMSSPDGDGDDGSDDVDGDGDW